MATNTVQSGSDAVQKAFQTGTVKPGAPEAVEVMHLPLDHVDIGSGTITATVASPSVGDAGLSHDVLREMFTYLARARAIDERIWQLNRAGQAPFVVSGQGHEAAQVGAAFALDRDKDILFPYYRDLALSHVFGLSALDILLGVFARATDPVSGGRQMPAHYGSAKHRIISGSSVIATQLPQATGAAYAARYRGTGQVVLVAFGEGATSEGDFHEACNFAGIHRLPVIFFCENNRYAISVPQDKQVAVENVADRASGYNFPGVVVDGTDLLAVYDVVKDAAERARQGEGPTLIEAKLYRFHPHSSDDDDRYYRAADEVKAWREHDPIGRFETRLREIGVLDDDATVAIMTRVKREVNEATEAAENAPHPDPATFDRYVYADAGARG
jgi:2-oxoisovalerate dehydrogenase E1 component alpha subunit